MSPTSSNDPYRRAGKTTTPRASEDWLALGIGLLIWISNKFFPG